MKRSSQLPWIGAGALLAASVVGLPAIAADPSAVPAPPTATTPPAGPDRSVEIATVIDALKSPVRDERVGACKSLSFSGITAAPVYDLIEQNVLGEFARIAKKGGYTEREAEQEIGWCAKALAYAGSEKYRPTLQRLARAKGRVADHAEAALERIENFARWNAIINDTAGHRPGESWQMTRAFNMLRSGDPPLEREGLKLAKEVKDDPTPLHDLVETKLLATYAQPFAAGSEDEDIVAWYCRSLAASRNYKYRESLRRVTSEAPSKKIRTYASKALGDLAAAD